jgi:hypothetical protein
MKAIIYWKAVCRDDDKSSHIYRPPEEFIQFIIFGNNYCFLRVPNHVLHQFHLTGELPNGEKYKRISA